MAKLTENRENFLLDLSREEVDVLYRVLKLTKQNAENTRLSLARGILKTIEKNYASKLSYNKDEALSRDLFGSICFTEVSHD